MCSMKVTRDCRQSAAPPLHLRYLRITAGVSAGSAGARAAYPYPSDVYQSLSVLLGRFTEPAALRRMLARKPQSYWDKKPSAGLNRMRMHLHCSILRLTGNRIPVTRCWHHGASRRDNLFFPEDIEEIHAIKAFVDRPQIHCCLLFSRIFLIWKTAVWWEKQRGVCHQ